MRRCRVGWQDIDDPTSVNLDNKLESVFGIKQMVFSNLVAKLSEHLKPAKPIETTYLVTLDSANDNDLLSESTAADAATTTTTTKESEMKPEDSQRKDAVATTTPDAVPAPADAAPDATATPVVVDNKQDEKNNTPMDHSSDAQELVPPFEIHQDAQPEPTSKKDMSAPVDGQEDPQPPKESSPVSSEPTMGSQIDVEVELDPQGRESKQFMSGFLLEMEEATTETDSIERQIAEFVQILHYHKRRRAFFLGFSESPVEFINGLVASQARDLENFASKGSTSANDDVYKASFYQQLWVEDAAVKYLHRKLAST